MFPFRTDGSKSPALRDILVGAVVAAALIEVAPGQQTGYALHLAGIAPLSPKQALGPQAQIRVRRCHAD